MTSRINTCKTHACVFVVRLPQVPFDASTKAIESADKLTETIGLHIDGISKYMKRLEPLLE